MSVPTGGTQPAPAAPPVPQAVPPELPIPTPVEAVPAVAPAPAPVPPAPAPAPAAAPAEPESDGGESDPAQPTSYPSHLKFSPDQQTFINERVANARLKGRESSRTYTLRELGVTTLDEGKALIGQARSLTTAADQTVTELRSQLGQLQGRFENETDSWRGKVTAAEHQREMALQDAKDTLRLARVQIVAARLGFRKPEDDPARFLDLDTLLVDLSAKSVTGVEDALQQLATDRPYLLAEKETPAPPAPPVEPEVPAPAPVPDPVVLPPAPAPVPEPVPPAAPEPPVVVPPPLPPTPPATNELSAEAEQEREANRRELARAVKGWF